ncbi:hypothetical protein [Luteolibacter luteus]|uniref:Uncharacterized protein n=1 Tax=Luteolibacter luteus TaxID=2728835 RepID=A0A858RIA4_9BACT|nr:hypothetical protein [Luteolibacter luteus]QJE95950.1 hypothetical protein HHL09_09205 [Luteolibacter luteus]
MSQFQVFLDASGNLTMAAGVVHCLHGTTSYFEVGDDSQAVLPRAGGDTTVQREVSAGASFHGGSGRNYIVKNGPAHPDFPAGYFAPRGPDDWRGPKGAFITKDPGTGDLALNDGTDVLATGSGSIGGSLTGVPSAGTFPITAWAIDGYYSGFGAYYQAVGYPGWVAFHSFTTGDVQVDFYGDPRLFRTGGSTTDPSGVWVANAQSEIDWNGGSPWTYTVAAAGLTGTMSGTTYGEDTYNGGAPFTFDLEAESDMPAWPNAAVTITPYSGTAQGGPYLPTGWQSWQSSVDDSWTVTIDGTGTGEWSDGLDIVATRAADPDRLYDPDGGLWVATAYGEATYGSGDPWAAEAVRTLATPMGGKLYLELTVNGSNEVTAVEGPFFAPLLPANTSTLKVFLIAESDGAGNIRQVWEGPINWIP